MSSSNLEERLDLSQFLQFFRSFFARPKSLQIPGDIQYYLKFIQALEKVEFSPPPQVGDISPSLQTIQKFGVLSFSQIFEIVKIVRYFFYLQTLKFPSPISNWIEKIEIPIYFRELDNYFQKDGKFRDEVDDRLVSIQLGIDEVKTEISQSLYSLLHSKRVEDFLVDRQIHYINDSEALLLKGGFSAVLKGNIVGRSSNGYFYIVPDKISNLLHRVRTYQQEREDIYLQYRKEISKKLRSYIPFLKFLNREFDKFDHCQARLNFAKSHDLQFLLPHRGDDIYIQNFYHPAIKNSPRPVNIDFSKSVLIVTGVNAGGKTMLLKSILSVVYLSKLLIPMKIDSFKSRVGTFRGIEAIIDDPQNVEFNISTFAGRMVAFSKILDKKNILIGVDEVELGTDSDEVSALFKVLLEKLIANGSKVVITTHHKRLASLMSSNPQVELVAGIYDEEKREPTYRFLQGTIGKSYAFETAERYGIPRSLVQRAKKIYGEDKEKLNELIEKSANLERELIEKNEILKHQIEELQREKEKLQSLREKYIRELQAEKERLSQEYHQAISEAKRAIKAKSKSEAHKHLTKAHELLPKEKEREISNRNFQVGDRVKYQNNFGTILEIRGKTAKVEIGSFKFTTNLDQLSPALKLPSSITSSVKIEVEKPKNPNIRLDLHGKSREEALEELDRFISNALIHGWNEVYIVHGIGQGVLARAVSQFLKNHPNVVWFGDAPPNLGGVGAKIVKL